MILDKVWPDGKWKRTRLRMLKRPMTGVRFVGDNLPPKEATEHYLVLALDDSAAEFQLTFSEREWLQIKAVAREEGEL